MAPFWVHPPMGQIKIALVLYFPDTPVLVYGGAGFKRGAEIVHVEIVEMCQKHVRMVDPFDDFHENHHI